MRERLIELIEQKSCYCNDCRGMNETENLADHLLDNGVVVLPCKVGSVIYSIRPGTKQIYECIVSRISFYECTDEIRYWIKDDGRYSNAAFSAIGKSIFFTKEEAEQEIERMKVND